MRAHELSFQINDACAKAGGVGGSQIVAINSHGLPHEIAGVDVEHHEDGSSTVWVRIEEM